MRAGWTRQLRDLLWAADPKAQVIIEAVVVAQEDTKDLPAEWAAADSLTGLESLDDGGLRLDAADDLVLDYTPAADTQITDLDSLAPIDALFVEWSGTDIDDMELHDVTLRVHPDYGGGGRQVEEWLLRVFRVSGVGASEGRIVLTPICDPARVSESASVERDITFDLGVRGYYPRVGDPPGLYLDDAGQAGEPAPGSLPVTVFMLFALKGDGEAAGNVAWKAKSGGPVSGGSGTTWTATHKVLEALDAPARLEGNLGNGGAYFVLTPSASGVPLIQINRPTFAPATATFSGSGNRPSLPNAVAEDVEFICVGEETSDSSLLFEAQASGGGTWYAVSDGDLAGTDNRYTDPYGVVQGHDLTALAVAQGYNMRVTLTPSSSLLRSPVVRVMGIRERTSTDLTGAANVKSVLWGVDAMTGKAEVTEAVVEVLKTGERDYRDYFSDLIAANYLSKIQIRISIGHVDPSVLPRRYWLHVDTFDVDDYTPGNAAGDLVCVSVLNRLLVTIPAFVVTDTPALGDGERVPEVYAGVTVKAALDDVIDSLIALPGRMRGPLLPATATDVVSKTLREAVGKDEADRLAYIAGYALIGSQGRVKAVQLMSAPGETRPPVAHFSREETAPILLGPGLRTRIDEFFVRYGYTEETGRWTGETRMFNSAAVDKLRSPGVDSTEEEDEETCKWLDSQAIAQKVGSRKVDHFWYGMGLWEINSIYPHPHLEQGDPVTIETDQFVGRSPIDGREIRGLVSARATLLQQVGVWGRRWVAWVKSFDDIIVTEKDVDRSDDGWYDPLAVILPELIAKRTQADNVASLELQVRDPQGRLVQLVYKTKSGGGDHDFGDPADGSWAAAPYTLI